MVDVGVFVGRVRRGRLLEVERAPLAVIREMQGGEAGAKHVRAVVEPWDSPSEVKVVHCGSQKQTGGVCGHTGCCFQGGYSTVRVGTTQKC